ALNQHGLSRLFFLSAQAFDLDWFVGFFGIELFLQHHLLVKLAHHYSLFVRSLWSLHLRLVRPRQIDFIQNQTVILVGQLHVLATREDLVAAMLLVPLRYRGVLVHVLDDVSPTDTGVVSTERNLAFLSAVRNDAHLGATEVVVEEILEPHTSDKQEVPTIRATLLDVLNRAIAADFAVILAGQTK